MTTTRATKKTDRIIRPFMEEMIEAAERMISAEDFQPILNTGIAKMTVSKQRISTVIYALEAQGSTVRTPGKETIYNFYYENRRYTLKVRPGRYANQRNVTILWDWNTEEPKAETTPTASPLSGLIDGRWVDSRGDSIFVHLTAAAKPGLPYIKVWKRQLVTTEGGSVTPELMEKYIAALRYVQEFIFNK